jgi:hypothetical protein
MDENEVLTTAETTETPDPPAPPFDPDEWERKRQEEWQKLLAPAKETRAQINDHDELLAEVLYEVTLLEIGEED